MADRDEEKESDKGFRVVDRRRFTSTGETRTDVPEEKPETPQVVGGGRPQPEPQRPAQQRPANERPPREQPRQGRGDPREAPRAQPPPRQPEPEPEPGPESGIDFLSFCASLATNALAALGLLPEEQTRGLPRNPELAREYIDILGMLQQKTRGNLSRQEEVALSQMVSDLRLQYVEVTRGPRR